MTIFSRHFVSQKFGRAVGTVHMDASGKGSVSIAFVADGVKPQEMTFSAAKFAACVTHGPLEELVLRTAIACLHRRAPLDTDGAVEELRPETPPWIGDFTAAPFGGATTGYPRAMDDHGDRRNGDEQLAASVEHGVRLRLVEGRPAARFYLQNARVPPSVIRRVLSNSVARRQVPDGPPTGAK
ncbi:MAG: hypothetical protein WKG03_11015 [Telluria sp.]